MVQTVSMCVQLTVDLLHVNTRTGRVVVVLQDGWVIIVQLVSILLTIKKRVYLVSKDKSELLDFQ